jgi:hypothetical protein
MNHEVDNDSIIQGNITVWLPENWNGPVIGVTLLTETIMLSLDEAIGHMQAMQRAIRQLNSLLEEGQ